MRQSSKQRSYDTSAIRKALAILEEEGLIIEETKDNVRIRRHSTGSYHTQPQHAVLSPPSSSSRRTNKAHIRRVSLTLEEATTAIDDDMTSCSMSHDGSSSSTVSSSCSYSCSSLKSDEDREVGGKGKRRSHTRRNSRRSHPHPHQKSKKEPEESTRSNAVNKKLSVRFSKYDQIEDIPNMNDMSQEIINATWMNEEDYEKIRTRSHKLIDMMEDPQKRYPISADTMIVNTHLVCVRGLEVNTTQQQHAREQHRRKLTTAVLR
mmetsp:Transcript_42824/g.48320  ORF Transcript_42824/g.48320 Transcript_42824/m.48320 type:complete len:263 (+) Transcript_42824:115-903(+)